MNNSISFITAFKKFVGLYDIIQKSVIYSWKMNDIKVIVPANETDTKIKCSDYSNITVIDEVKRARELGFSNQSPVLKDLIEKALPHIDTTMVAFINSDIMILEDFAQKCEKIFQKYGYDIFIVGSRLNIRLNYYADSPEGYKKALSEPRLPYDDITSSDIFITSKFMWKKILQDMPEFILGRYCWDNWLHTFAEINNLKKYNCTKTLVTLHCEHPNSMIYAQEGFEGKEAPSSKHNLDLWQPIKDVYGYSRIRHWPAIQVD